MPTEGVVEWAKKKNNVKTEQQKVVNIAANIKSLYRSLYSIINEDEIWLSDLFLTI